MSEQHKKALATGREQGRAVRAYLEWLELRAPRRGRKRDTSPERLSEIEERIAEAESVLQRLQLIQLRRDLEDAADNEEDPREEERVRRAFVKAARAYGDAKGITYASWREIGVPAAVLREAGITRGGR
ncbi:MAG: hypothetical protein JOZ99_07885 [Actinobacteria bacterium]|nr:hypothetical protein [Actinomycetota bacterium]